MESLISAEFRRNGNLFNNMPDSMSFVVHFLKILFTYNLHTVPKSLSNRRMKQKSNKTKSRTTFIFYHTRNCLLITNSQIST